MLVSLTVREENDRLLLRLRRVDAYGVAERFDACPSERIVDHALTLLEEAVAEAMASRTQDEARVDLDLPSEDDEPAPETPGPGPEAPALGPPRVETSAETRVSPPNEAVIATEAESAEPETAVTTDAEAASVAGPGPRVAPATTERVRVVLEAYAGIERYGYGGGVRVELPMASPLEGADDALALGLGVGVGYVAAGIDGFGNGYEAVQLPGLAYLTWRFGLGDVEIAPRIGGAVLVSAGGFTGPALAGTRVALVGMGTVGVAVSLRVADVVQLVGALELGLGTHTNGIVSLGVGLG